MGFITKICNPSGVCPILWDTSTGELSLDGYITSSGGRGHIDFLLGHSDMLQFVDASITSKVGAGPTETNFAVVCQTDGDVQWGSNDNNRASQKRPRWMFVKDAVQVGDSSTITSVNTVVGGPIGGTFITGRGPHVTVSGSPNGSATEPPILGFLDEGLHIDGFRASNGATSSWTNKDERDIGVIFAYPGGGDFVEPKPPVIIFQLNHDIRINSATCDIVFQNNNSNDIGSDSFRLKNIYIGTSVNTPTIDLKTTYGGQNIISRANQEFSSGSLGSVLIKSGGETSAPLTGSTLELFSYSDGNGEADAGRIVVTIGETTGGTSDGFVVKSAAGSTLFKVDGAGVITGSGINQPQSQIIDNDIVLSVSDSANKALLNNPQASESLEFDMIRAATGTLNVIHISGSAGAIGAGSEFITIGYNPTGGDHYEIYAYKTGGTATFPLRIFAPELRIEATKIGFFDATPVVQQAAIADASGGAIIDAEARTALNSLLAKIRTLGLIDT